MNSPTVTASALHRDSLRNPCACSPPLRMEPIQPESTPPTVLIGDDDVNRADRHADCLPLEYTVQTANTLDSAVEMLTADVNVALINDEIGDTAGEVVLASARTRGFEGRAVLLADGNQNLERIDEQFDDLLTTPVSRTAVEETIERMLERDVFDTRLEAILSFVSRMSTLESKLSIEELQNSESYARLDARLDEYRKQGVELGNATHDEYAHFSREKLRVVLS